MKKSIIALAAALLAAPAAAQEAPAGDAESVIMVLDGSGSMWGQIDGTPKIEIARGVIGDLLENWDSNVQLGLVAYGHRRKGACDDIETLVEVGPVDKAAVTAKIANINPVGKTPISASVRQAAEALKYTEEKATVILVSDGLETCNADPCALASELEAKGVDFTAHVVGFDLKEEEQAKLACLAENTGGKFISASNAGELTTALAETVEAVKQPAPAAEPQPEPKAPAEQGVKLSARMCDTCEMQEGVYWRIFEGEKALDGSRKQIKTSGADAPFIELPAGDYHVTAQLKDVAVGQDFTVPEGEGVNVEVNLNAGALRVGAVASEGGQKLEEKMYYRVFAAKKDLSGNREQVAAAGGAAPLFHLAAGEYVIQATHGKAVTEAPVTIEAGKLTEQTLDLNVGYLRVSAAMTDAGAALDKGVYYRVFDARTDLSGNRKQIDAAGGASPLFRLPAGEYVVQAAHGKAIVEAPVTIVAGSLEEKKLIANSGRIKVSAVLNGAAPKGAYFRILEGEPGLDGTAKQIDAGGGASRIFTLPAGAYVVRVQYERQNFDQNVSVAAGEEKAVEVKINP